MISNGDHYTSSMAAVPAASGNTTGGVSRKNTLSKVAKLFGAGNSTKNLQRQQQQQQQQHHHHLHPENYNGINGKIRTDAAKSEYYHSTTPLVHNGKNPLSPASSTSSITSSVSAVSTTSNSPTAATTPGAAGVPHPLGSSKVRDHNNVSDPAISHTSSTLNISSAYGGSSTNLASIQGPSGRFVVHEDGTHEHHLRNTKRQEKLTRMIKSMAVSQKVRGQAKSAVPDIMIENKGNQQIPQQQRVDPPTLFAGLIKQMGSDNELERENVPFSGATHGTDKRLYTPSLAGTSSTQGAAATNNSTTSLARRDPLCLGDKYGRCQGVLGKGSFGVVRVCHKKTTNSTGGGKGEILFAVKEFKKKPSEPAEKYAKRLTSEFCISSSLRHINIIMTLDLFQDAKGDYCEVMEYCAGGDLFTLIITAGKLEYLEADCFFKQLVRGVVYMHDMGVCHRDLKPENLLLTSDGTLKIIDFGNSECFQMAWEKDIHLSGGVCGSSPYIAPEEYTQDEFDPRPVDIWACGVIYMAMRTGRQLWKVAQKEDQFFSRYLRKRKEKGGFEPIESLKRARCRNVIYSMLDPVANRRINGKQILNSEWGREIKCCNDGHALD